MQKKSVENDCKVNLDNGSAVVREAKVTQTNNRQSSFESPSAHTQNTKVQNGVDPTYLLENGCQNTRSSNNR